ncbi:hypothetical protein CONPUDRAFT_147299 [Coniophora puteana RWD-64-598 SS2]|uniref:MYND-type domain-containing protein n=1 Tax=Coniophora puteana (strain RWD-64-598) TaxID=741705 RepID=A0A5M3M7B4_CONPW|nr:uncharacterized protein CONPUDRAFT_147299 [Coniophora puteana RWD-64-598 SS2]EIW75128.1 hypothetical protein CONPUDRAFT_147299 [Coniophora puteana RWD-64-598 SS2]
MTSLFSDAEIQAVLHVTPDSLAEYSGIIDVPDNNQTDEVKAMFLDRQIAILQRQQHTESEKLYCAFAAKYLPEAVAAFKAQLEAYCPPMVVINVVTTTPYFIRFSRLPGGRDLAAIMASKVAAIPLDRTDIQEDIAAAIGQFLATLLAVQGVESVSGEDREKVLKLFRKWSNKFSGSFAEETLGRCIDGFEGESIMQQMMAGMREMLSKPVEECGAPRCEKRHDPGTTNLMQCGKCKTAVYCSPQHQKLAWKKHKQLCYPTAF